MERWQYGYKSHSASRPLDRHTAGHSHFDATFVDDNVYSGQEVHPAHRQKFLQFVLGAESVKLEREIVRLAKEIADEHRNIKEREQRIRAYSKNMPIADFIRLIPVTDAEAKIAALRTQREAVRNAPALLQRHAPQPLPHIECNIDAFFSIIQSTFHDIRADAEEIVQAHFQRHQQPPGIEAWVMQGGIQRGTGVPVLRSRSDSHSPHQGL